MQNLLTLENPSAATPLKWPSQISVEPHLRCRAHLTCDGTGDLDYGHAAKILQQLCDAFLSIWTKINLQHLDESMACRINVFLKHKGGQTQY